MDSKSVRFGRGKKEGKKQIFFFFLFITTAPRSTCYPRNGEAWPGPISIKKRWHCLFVIVVRIYARIPPGRTTNFYGILWYFIFFFPFGHSHSLSLCPSQYLSVFNSSEYIYTLHSIVRAYDPT